MMSINDVVESETGEVTNFDEHPIGGHSAVDECLMNVVESETGEVRRRDIPQIEGRQKKTRLPEGAGNEV